MNYQGNIKYRETWYGVRAEFIVDDPGEEGNFNGHPDSWYPPSPPSLYFEEVHIEDEDGLKVNHVPVLEEALESELLERLGEDDDYEFDIYLN